ncbi:tetraacyldisaccharide 4'-kinase [Silvibacterium dinghuense]|uniref:Tetraacyldisaccharide 4'-kinase n=1 Tax=Silvibacterium dinghuense TaxID=1560006 RepID=A0A4Q1SI89_9BACT|nr:tetraacyldisaccharide 4'-kinase [Silvibacterium dinghuense]RXS97093.1 tetraacyldisaccharide 4'-kinase [Silvibacterium dinghuense]GGG96150.1 hypothetical protein GCM10011586_09100 [Silvibacterium dinghuense]
MILAPLTPLYAAAVAAKNLAYDRGWRQAHHLEQPVLSVGNLSTGGSGKTPFVHYLAGLVKRMGHPVDVLSRGYGRATKGVLRVDPGGSARDFGDEPLLLARAGIPVYVGADRYQAGLLAESTAPAIHLLDDGFQHRQLARDADIVLVHATDFANRLLPAGRLREPLSALRRASVVVLRQEDVAREEQIRNLGVTCPVWIQRRHLSALPAGRALAFCGIARPEEFFAGLERKGVELAATRAFADHHPYAESDLDQLLRLAASKGADFCVTTEKDAVRLGDAFCARIRAQLPLEVPRLEVTLTDEPAAAEWLTSIVRK